MKRVWRTRRIDKRAKKQFFNALILSGLLYNCETWAMNDQQKRQLRHQHHKMSKKIVGEFGEPKVIEGVRETVEQFMDRHGLPSVDAHLAGRKAVWLGHAKRNKDELMLQAFEEAKNDGHTWWNTLSTEVGKFDVTPEWVYENAENRGLIRGKFRKN